MNQFFLYWVDITAILLSVAISIYLSIKAARTSRKSVRGIAAFFLFFGPAAICVHMSFHLFEIFYRAGVSAAAGKFVYNFRFYSLQLMGIVLAYLSGVMVYQAFQKCTQSRFANRKLIMTMAFIVFLSAPTIPFTPIGSLPTMACIISLIALPFFIKRKTNTVLSRNEVPAWETVGV